jgi:hypothetical protein
MGVGVAKQNYFEKTMKKHSLHFNFFGTSARIKGSFALKQFSLVSFELVLQKT